MDVPKKMARGREGRCSGSAKCVPVPIKGDTMITWVLVEEPTFEVARAIEIVEYRLNSDPDAVQWICAHLPVVEPAQD